MCSSDLLSSSNLAADMTPADMQQWVLAVKNMFSVVANIDLIYGALIVIELVVSCSVVVVILNAIARRKDKALPKINELLKFRISRVAVLILVGSMLLMSMGTGDDTAWNILGLNIQFFLIFLFQIAGALALIALLVKSSMGKGIKIIGSIIVLILMFISPTIVMLFGCLDSLFNYRKVEIVV